MFKKLLSLSALALVATGVMTANAEANNRTRDCKPVTVGVFSNRLHVRCASIDGQGYTKDIRYYAMKMDDSVRFRSTLDLLLIAKANDRMLRVNFDESDYKSVPGCGGSNCRRLVWVTMR